VLGLCALALVRTCSVAPRTAPASSCSQGPCSGWLGEMNVLVPVRGCSRTSSQALVRPAPALPPHPPRPSIFSRRSVGGSAAVARYGSGRHTVMGASSSRFGRGPVLLLRRAALSSLPAVGLDGAATATKAAIADKGMESLMDTPPPVSPLEQLPDLHAIPSHQSGKGIREVTSMVHLRTLHLVFFL
jgi:hypothetical protein